MKVTKPKGEKTKITVRNKKPVRGETVIFKPGQHIDAVAHNVFSRGKKGDSNVPEITNAEAFEQWKEWMQRNGYSPRTIEDRISWVNALVRDSKLTSKHPADITEDVIREWLYVTKQNTKITTRYTVLSAIRDYFRFCIARNYSMNNPAKKVRIDRRELPLEKKKSDRTREITNKEFEDLRQFIYEKIEASVERGNVKFELRYRFWYAAIHLSRYAGLKMADICRLHRSSFKKKGYIIVGDDYGGQVYSIKMHPRLAEAMKLAEWSRDGYLNPNAIHQSLSTHFSRICNDNLGLEGIKFKSLRHTYIQECLRNGVPMPHIATRE